MKHSIPWGGLALRGMAGVALATLAMLACAPLRAAEIVIGQVAPLTGVLAGSPPRLAGSA